MKSSPFVIYALVAMSLGCHGSSPAPGPDAAAPASPDAAPEQPPPPKTVAIGTSPICQVIPGTSKADVGPDLKTEVGDPAVARITPPSYPFKVTKISYQLTGMEAKCGTNIAHAVSVYAGPTVDTPPTTPTDVQRIEVAGSAADQATYLVTETLPTLIVLTQGQDLYVAVEMDANAAKTVAVCLDGCHINADDHRQFWSENTQAPFTWATLYSFGVAVDYAIWAEGEPQ